MTTPEPPLPPLPERFDLVLRGNNQVPVWCDSDMEAYVLADRAARSPVPAGWKLVPIEPTDEMKIAGDNAGFWCGDKYRAMLAAAPLADSTERSGKATGAADGDRADAERYRWLRERPSFIGWDWWEPKVPHYANITPEFMDEAIDAAKAASDRDERDAVLAQTQRPAPDKPAPGSKP